MKVKSIFDMTSLFHKATLILLFLCPLTCSVNAPAAVSANIRHRFIPEHFILETLTVYNPLVGQCDSDPLTTASNKRIDTLKLRNGELRWMALSRDMLQGWGGKLQYGDTVHVSAGDQAIDGQWVIQDTMHRRYQRHGDLLFDPTQRSSGKWHKVTVTRYRKNNDG
jgi:hypothetical protein